jgi:hypothetical protein
MSFPQPAAVLSEADIAAIRACGRGVRNLGYVFCLVGVMTMISGRFMAGAPAWLTSLGVGIVVFGWGLLAFALTRRLAMVRKLMARRGG